MASDVELSRFHLTINVDGQPPDDGRPKLTSPMMTSSRPGAKMCALCRVTKSQDAIRPFTKATRDTPGNLSAGALFAGAS